MQLRAAGARRWAIGVINGPNMKYIGGRDPEIFGPITSIDYLDNNVTSFGEQLGVDVACFASNAESEIIEFVRSTQRDGFLINPAGLTTYGDSTRDALTDSGRPYVEVHFANLSTWFADMYPGEHVTSRFTHTASGVMMGLRHYGYLGALLGLVLALDDEYFLGKTARQEAE